MASIEVIIETPKGSVEKYEYVEGTPFFKLKKILPSAPKSKRKLSGSPVRNWP